MAQPTFLTVDEIIDIHRDQITRYGGSHGIRDRGLLESAVSAPAASFGGHYAHADEFEMAAAYLFHLVKNHPFIDGNKRAGAATADVFLQMNGWELENDEPAFSELVLAIATDRAGKRAVADFFRACSRPMP